MDTVFKNGWTKESVIKHMKNNFKGKAVSRRFDKTEGACMYLTQDGRKCAVGLFIPDGHKAQQSMLPAKLLINAYPDLEKILPLRTREVSRLQAIHDGPGGDIRDDKEILNEMIQYVEGLE